MPWKLLFILLLFGLFIAFAGFNLENTSVISFGFFQIESVPVFISLSIAFLLGAVFTVVFITFGGFRKTKKKIADNQTIKSLPQKGTKQEPKFPKKNKQQPETTDIQE
ncbi:lipopolysaccharide assembly protein LapA domain-containing protein [Spirochaeta lutea]|uniref:lipopolysaccharide assembly protein LapA domain-containing protein n=1 Tax=Spirochaeta lutea TaxID=1480694 RepID=UPI00068CA0D4|nr:lipopolysaccharide assembly protein LapA domain-containing protein [Spirochaeta lutea]